MVSVQSSSPSGPTVSVWSTSPDWLVSIGLLSSRPSNALYHSVAFHHIILKHLYPTGYSWCQMRVMSHRGYDGWHYSLSLSIENMAICVCIVLTYHCNRDNTPGWVVLMWSRDFCLAVIAVAIVVAYNRRTLTNHHMIVPLCDPPWPPNCDQS